MSKRRKIFIICVIWFLICIPIGGYWASRPALWALGEPLWEEEELTPEYVAKLFPIHLASLPASKFRQHVNQIDSDEPEEPPKEFDPREWGVREAIYRSIVCFAFWIFSGFYMNWFLGRIIRGQDTWAG